MQRMMKKIWKRKRGFTLVELLIVVAIIGVLAGIAIPSFLGARTKAKIARSFADMDAIAKAEDMYYVDNGEYTTNSTTLVDNDYISSVPSDPFGGSSYTIETSPDTNPSMFLIRGYGPDGDNNDSTGHTWSDRVRGALGGSEGATSGYNLSVDGTSGSNLLYHPSQGSATGTSSDGDVAYGSG